MKNRIVFYFVLSISVLAMFIFACFECSYTDRIRYGRYYLEDSSDWNSGIPFNYFLLDEKDNSVISFFLNDYINYDGYLYFSEVNGGLFDYYCFYESKLYLSRINLNNNKIERFINEKESAETYLIYLKINEMSDYDISWLRNNNKKCSEINKYT